MPRPLATLWQVGCTPMLDVFLQNILRTSHVKTTCQALGLNNRSLEHPSLKVCCEVELHRHPVRSDSLHCSFQLHSCRFLHGVAVWPAFARLISYKNCPRNRPQDVRTNTIKAFAKSACKDLYFVRACVLKCAGHFTRALHEKTTTLAHPKRGAAFCGTLRLVRSCAVNMHIERITTVNSRKNSKKIACHKRGGAVLSELAQRTCTWTSRKNDK